MRFLIAFSFLAQLLLTQSLAQSRAEYAGGTVTMLAAGAAGAMEIADQEYFAFYSKGAQVRIPYQRINLLEYGQKVDRRYLAAIVVSPVLILSKSRKHFLTLGYADDGGHQQAIVFRVDKNSIRPVLAGLEARTGLKVQYQDVDARRAGKG